jgi:TRAP-type C4-dicarboxylate transport system permease small subunit
MRRAAHLKIDVVVRRLPLAGQAVLFVFNQLVVAGVGAVMMIWGAEQALRFWSRESLVLELPLGPLYGFIPLSGLGIMIEALWAIPGGLRRVRRGLPPEDESVGFALDGDEEEQAR